MVNTNTYRMIAWMAVLVFCEFWALYFIQKAQKVNNSKLVIPSMLLYGFGVALLLYKLMNFRSIAIINFLWNVCSTISGFFITLYIFKEKVNNLEWLGAALGVLSIGLIIYGGNQKEQKAN